MMKLRSIITLALWLASLAGSFLPVRAAACEMTCCTVADITCDMNDMMDGCPMMDDGSLLHPIPSAPLGVTTGKVILCAAPSALLPPDLPSHADLVAYRQQLKPLRLPPPPVHLLI